MITGQIRNQIDKIWNIFWETGGITNPMTVLEQMTYLFFIKLLDDDVRKQEKLSNELGINYVSEGIFDYGDDGKGYNPETNEKVDVESLRWKVFKHMEANTMYRKIQRDVFPYIKNLYKGENSAYSRFMQNATFLIASPRALQKIVDDIDQLEMSDRDTMGDVYEYMLGKMAASGQNGQFRAPRHIIKMMVELMKPSIADTICDPAMGSDGFIVEAPNYVKKHYETE